MTMYSFLAFLLICPILMAEASSVQGGGIRNYFREIAKNQQDQAKLNPSNSSTFNELYGFDIAGQIRQDWEAIREKILLMSQHEKTRGLIQEFVDVNPCVSSLEGYLSFLEQGIKLIENYAPELDEMILTLLSLRGERNMTVLTSKGADILLLMDVILPAVTSYNCQATLERGVSALRELSLVLFKLSNLEDIPNIITESARQKLLNAARLTEALSNLVDHANKNAAKIDCYTSKDSMGDFFKLTAATISDMAEFAGSLGYLHEAKEIRQYSSFINSVVDSLENIEEFKAPGDCSPGGLRRNALILKDISNIVAEVGLESLGAIGVYFRIDLLP